jgi:hypothetical protein
VSQICEEFSLCAVSGFSNQPGGLEFSCSLNYSPIKIGVGLIEAPQPSLSYSLRFMTRFSFAKPSA